MRARSLPLALVIAGTLAWPGGARAQSSDAEAGPSPSGASSGRRSLSHRFDDPTSASPAWYDADELLGHVRPSMRADLPAQLEVADLSALPLYDLSLSIAEDMGSYGLRETIWVTNEQAAPMREVVLRVFANVIVPSGEAPPVSLVRGACLDGASCTVSEVSRSVWRVVPSAPIPPGGHLRIELDVTGVVRALAEERMSMIAQGMESMQAMQDPGRAAQTDYGLLAHGQGIGSFANFFAVLARRDGDAWVTEDEGTTGDLGTDAMANVRARIVVPRSLRVVSSGAEVRRRAVREADGSSERRVEITVHAGVIRDFAVLAGPSLAVGTRQVGETLVRSYYLPEDTASGQSVLDTTAHALEIFERRFGPYPYTELDVVEAPLVGGAGGVEFSALVTVASMFYRPAMAGGGLGGIGALMGMLEGAETDEASADAAGLDPMQGSILEFVTAHEAAHQWWHGIVGSDSRRHPWVDESLAQYSAMLYFEDRHGAARAEEEGERQVAMNFHAMRVEGHADGAVDRAASAFPNPMDYAGLVYGKGPYLYRALRHELGDETFFERLRAYVTTYRMRIAPARGVVDVMAAGGHASRVRALARRWLDERHGDEDLGPSTMDGMMQQMLPPEIAADPQMRAMMGQLMQSMMGGGGGGADLGSLLGGSGGGEGGSLSPEMMEAIEQMLGGGALGGLE